MYLDTMEKDWDAMKYGGLAPLQTMGLKGLKFGFPVAVPKELVNKIPSILILYKYGWKR